MIWDIDPVAVHTSVISLRWYGFFLSTALIASYYQLRWLMVTEVQVTAFERILPAVFLGSIIGARIGHFVFYAPDALLASPMILVDFSVPGLASHGAIVGGTFAVWLVARWRKDVDFFWFLSRIAFSFVVFCVLIRVGNFFNSELVGTPTDLPWAVQFPRIDELFRHPVQLYESFAYLICHGVLLSIYKRGLSAKDLLGSVLIAMSLLRLLLENFKAGQSSLELALPYTLGYLLTLPVLVVGIGLLVWSRFSGGTHDITHDRPRKKSVTKEKETSI
jgi:phosphatidylglycerol:prolipoprotein diacylglycerol transferase